jgi:hypothetical protein
VQSDGAVDAWSLAAGGPVVQNLDLGATLQVLRGEQNRLVRTRWIEEGWDDFSRLEISGLDGVRGIFGAAWHPHHAVSAAAVYRTGTELSGDYRSSADGIEATTGSLEMKYPGELIVGAAWRPRAKLRTTVRLEGSWVEWSDYRDGFGTQPALDDVWDARLGIEHVFYNGFPIRFGIRYSPAPLDEEVATTAFTFGGGLDVGPLRADLAFEVVNRNYRFPDLFDDATFGGDTHVTTDLVEESGTSAFLTLGARWAPFGG